MPQFTVKNKGAGLTVKPLFSQSLTTSTKAPSVTQVYRDATRNKLNMATGTGAPGVKAPTTITSPLVNAKQTSNSGSGGTGGNVSSQLQSIYQQQLNAQNNIANDLANQLKAQQEAHQAQLRNMQEQQRQAAQNAYNNNLSALQSAYNNRLAGLNNNLASTKDLLGSAYENSRQNLNANAEKALQEAYINRMMNERSLQNQLNAQGLNGGAAESTIASMLNNYGNARNNINTSVDDSLRELEQNYNSNLATAQQKYNDALTDAANSNMAYRMQLENDLNNNILGSYQNMYNAFSNLDGDYTNAMYNLLNKQANDSADLQSALYSAMMKNASAPAKVSVNSTIASPTTNAVNNVKRMASEGMTPQQILDNMTEYTDEEVAQIFMEAGLL